MRPAWQLEIHCQCVAPDRRSIGSRLLCHSPSQTGRRRQAASGANVVVTKVPEVRHQATMTVYNAWLSASQLHDLLKKRLLLLGRGMQQKLPATPKPPSECHATPRKEVVSR